MTKAKDSKKGKDMSGKELPTKSKRVKTAPKPVIKRSNVKATNHGATEDSDVQNNVKNISKQEPKKVNKKQKVKDTNGISIVDENNKTVNEETVSVVKTENTKKPVTKRSGAKVSKSGDVNKDSEVDNNKKANEKEEPQKGNKKQKVKDTADKGMVDANNKSDDVSEPALVVKSETTKAAQKAATKRSGARASKRGANEDSEVRYDKKHKEKQAASKSSKKQKTTDSNSENICTSAEDDQASVFSGNEDDKGSVVSAVLDEDICYECGLSTLNGSDWDSVIMCDVCDGEYHLHCLGLKSAPEGSFVCVKCQEESSYYADLQFSVSDDFKIPERPAGERSIVYSPAKPLDLAWEECKTKGLMVVSNVFDKDLMRTLTHGTVQKVMRTGRVAEQWQGGTCEVAKRVSASACHGIIDRNGRYDLRLPDYVIADLRLEERLQPILSRLASIMGHPKPQLRTHNVVFVPVGSGIQEWHVDDSMAQPKRPRYFTVLINLNPLDAYCGGTEVWIDALKKGDLIRARPGDALVFNGSLLHRGHANSGFMHRFFYYASFACGQDANTGNDV